MSVDERLEHLVHRISVIRGELARGASHQALLRDLGNALEILFTVRTDLIQSIPKSGGRERRRLSGEE